MLKRILALSLSACMIILTLTSCGPREVSGEPVSSNSSSSSSIESSQGGVISNNDNSSTSPDGDKPNGPGDNRSSNPNTPNNSSSIGTEPKGMKTIKIWWNNDDESMLAAKRNYNMEHKDVLFNITAPPEYTVEKLKVAISAGNEPNIVWLDHVYITSLGKSGMILDLNPYGAKKLESTYLSSCWNGVSFGGKTYGLPHDGNTIALMYNKTMLDAANQRAPKTYSQLINVGKQVKKYIDTNKDKGDYAFTSPFFDTNGQGRLNWSAFVYFFWLWRNGGEILNSSNTAATFNSTAGVTALNQLKGLVTSGICAPSKYMESQFYNGTIGMIEMGNWALPSLTAADRNANFGVSMLPTLKSGVTNWSGLGLYALGVTSKTKYKQEAFDFIKYYTTNDTYQLQYGKQHKQLPVTKSALKDSYYSSGFWKVYIAQYAKSKSRPGVSDWDKMEKEIATAVNNVISGSVKAKDALDTAAKRVNAMLK